MQNIFLVSMELKKGGLKVLFGELDMGASLMGAEKPRVSVVVFRAVSSSPKVSHSNTTEMFSISFRQRKENPHQQKYSFNC